MLHKFQIEIDPFNIVLKSTIIAKKLFWSGELLRSTCVWIRTKNCYWTILKGSMGHFCGTRHFILSFFVSKIHEITGYKEADCIIDQEQSRKPPCRDLNILGAHQEVL